MTLSPVYRVALNKNLLVDLGFIDFLKQQFRNVLYSTIGQRHVDTEQVYRFTIYEIPPQWDSFVLSTILMAQAGFMEMTLKQEKISQILLDLNPLDPKPIDLEFRLSEIVNWVVNKCGHYTELLPGVGLIHYFGINQLAWFDDYPIQTGTVMRAVDYGTLDNFPLHLFDFVFNEIRLHLMDLFTLYNNGGVPDIHVDTTPIDEMDEDSSGGN